MHFVEIQFLFFYFVEISVDSIRLEILRRMNLGQLAESTSFNVCLQFNFPFD